MRKRSKTKELLLSVFALGLVFGFASFRAPTKTLGRDKMVGSTGFILPSNLVHYQIHPSRSRFVVRAYVGGLLSAFGHNHTIAVRDFTGEVHISPDNVESRSRS